MSHYMNRILFPHSYNQLFLYLGKESYLRYNLIIYEKYISFEESLLDLDIRVINENLDKEYEWEHLVVIKRLPKYQLTKL